MNNIQFHLLDTVARDICVEAEDETTRQIHYESPPTSEDEEDGPKRYKRYNSQERKELVIQLYGSTIAGKSVQVDVVGFRPTFYLALPQERTLHAIDAIRAYLTFQGIPLSQLTLKQIQRKKFYGFTANQLFPFLEITAPSLALFRNLKNLFLDEKSLPHTKRALGPPFKRGESPEVYEANLDPMLRFFHVQNIKPCGWVQIEGGISLVEDASASTWTLTSHYTDIQPLEQATTAPFCLASWDIECYSQTGDFPVASKTWTKVAETLNARKGAEEIYAAAIRRLFDTGVMGQLRSKKTVAQLEAKLRTKAFQSLDLDTDACAKLLGGLKDVLTIGDPVIQIGTTLTRNTSDADLERHLFVWPSCDPIEGIVVHAYEDESAMIEAWFK